MRDGFQIFDTHTHLGAARHSGRQCDESQMLAHMDRHGIDRSMLIPFPVVDDYRATHDLIAQALARHPGRFAAAACLDPFVPPAEYTTEIARCASLGFGALKIQPQYQAVNPLSTRNDHIFEAALRHRLALIVHTGAGAPFALPSLWIAAARRFPDLPIILGHAGGGLYVLEAIVAALECPNIYIELSSLMPHHVLEVLRHVPASRLMAGSDLPESIEAEFDKILTLEIDGHEKTQILWETPTRVFRTHSM
ncbi:MAG: amidohydrolase family protein [Bryobacteraceae bacterium]